MFLCAIFLLIIGLWGLKDYFKKFRKIKSEDSLDVVLNFGVLFGSIGCIIASIVCFLEATGLLHLRE